MRDVILSLHIGTSIMACVVTFIILMRGILGSFQKVVLSALDVKLPFVSTFLLYVQFVLGTGLYILFMNNYAKGDLSRIVEAAASGRFWVVEHFILMVFTLVMSHIGWIFSRNTKTPLVIFRKNMLYFGMAFMMIVVSITVNFFR